MDYKRKFLIIIIATVLFLVTITGVQAAFVANLIDNKSSYPNNQIPKYSKFELTFDINGLVTNFPVVKTGFFMDVGKFTDRDLNPFNPDVVDIQGVFSPPGCNFGSSCTLNAYAFWWQDFIITMPPDPTQTTLYSEVIAKGPQGNKWKIRFTPLATGTYEYYIKIIEKGQETGRTPTYTFTTINSSNKGFIRQYPNNKMYFKFDNGEPYNAVGLNLPPGASLTEFGKVFKNLKQNQINFSGFTDGTSFFKLQWFPNNYGGQINWWQGLGRYNLAAAYRQDKIIELAENNGIYLNINWGEEQLSSSNWPSEPYNIATCWPSPCNANNQGVISTNFEFFTSPLAKKYYEREIRYYMARWSYSPAVFSWEAFNEFDWLVTGEGWHEDSTKWQQVNTWFQVVATYQKNLDIYTHPSSGGTGVSSWENVTLPQYEFWRQYWTLPVWDFIHAHNYQLDPLTSIPCEFDTLVDTLDVPCNNPPSWYHGTKYMPPHYGLPVIIGEWATNPFGSGDYTRQNLHDAIWVTALNGGTVLPWYYDWANSNGWIPTFKPLAQFMADEDLGGLNMKRVRYPTTDKTQLQAFGLANNSHVLGWIRNTGSPTNGTVTFSNMQNGSYTVEIWDTWNGGKLSTGTVSVIDGNLNIPLPIFIISTAVKAQLAGISPTPTPTPIPGDVDNDKHVTLSDFLQVVSRYGATTLTSTAEDINHDNKVNIIDLGIVIKNYGL